MRVELGKVSRVMGSIALGLVVLGLLVNAKDVLQYIRISTM